MVRRSSNAVIPSLPAGWTDYSTLSPRKLPFTLLSAPELRFLDSITSRSLFSRDEFLFLLHDCFPSLVGNLSNDSLGRNLLSNECYADREYFDSDCSSLGSIRVFRLGLVCAVPMPSKGVRFKHWYCYPQGTYQLLPENFARPFPPHDPFAGWCFRELHQGLSEGELSPAPPSLRSIPLIDSSGEYVADHCYRVRVDGRTEPLWVEIHTGSEGYEESVFIKRLLSAELFLSDKGRFVLIVPFKRSLAQAHRIIQSYNQKAAVDDSKPALDLEISEIITFQGIKRFKEKLGFYEHTRRV